MNSKIYTLAAIFLLESKKETRHVRGGGWCDYADDMLYTELRGSWRISISPRIGFRLAEELK